ncbi:MAG: homoserine dehydrogenase [Hyphomicrobiales bacterium]|nr:homoserine dehydrogenase [Hyphomicrobiales bacterium]
MSEKVTLAIAGLGTVGGAVLRQLRDNADVIAARCGSRRIEVVAVSARDRNRDRGVSLDGLAWHQDALELVDVKDVDIVVELIGGQDGVAKALIEKALRAGKHVVTANKAACAHHGVAFAELAQTGDVQLRFEAAIAGGVPVVKSIKEALAGNRIRELRGILNGTCNYILTSMSQSRCSYDESLAEAQRLGYAEADPSLDVGGIDAAHKLALLSALAFRHRPAFDAVQVEGIEAVTQEDIGFAQEFGCEIRLLATARRHDNDEIEQWVRPALVPRDSLLAHVQSARNGISLRGDFGGNLFFAGDGAGGEATASAVVADIIDIVAGRCVFPLGAALSSLPECSALSPSKSRGCFYLRLHATDRAGSMAAITRELASAEISIEQIIQTAAPARDEEAKAHSGRLPVALLTHEACESVMRGVLDGLAKHRDIIASPLLLRMEAR